MSRLGTRGWVTMSLLATATVGWPPTAAAQWQKSTDWLFLCTSLLEVRFGPDHPACDEVHEEGGIKHTLDAASRWLEGLGFASPAISANLDLAFHMHRAPEDIQALHLANQWDPRCEARYCAWLGYALSSHGQYSSADSSLLIDPFPSDPNEKYDSGFGFAEVHELFHAVQHGYPSVQASRDSGHMKWITEGTAEHVSRAFGRRMQYSSTGAVWVRPYDQPLHQPPTEDEDDRRYHDWAYGSWEFFEFLGEYLGSTDGVQFLDDMFGELAPDEKNGLSAVEATLRRQTGGGLHTAFPAFVTHRLDRPCYFTHLGEWAGLDCVEGADNEHRFELTFPDTVLRQHSVADLAANGYIVRMTIPEKEVALLTIRVPPDQDEEYLHLVVDDRLYDAPNEVQRRNEYSDLLSGGRHEFMVRLVHAPRDLSNVGGGVWDEFNFTGDDNAPIEFVLIRQTVRATVSGSENGNLDGVLFSYVNPEADPQAVAREITPDLTERYADYAGLDESTEEGRQAREQIRAAVAEASPPPATSAVEVAPDSLPTPKRPARCIVVITLFNDSARAVARIHWEGPGPFLGGVHDVRATYAHGLHDAVYGTAKQVGQEIALMDDPEAMASWGEQFATGTVPGAMDLLRMAMSGESSGNLDVGRMYEDGGSGKLWVAESEGEKAEAAFRFTASGENGSVVVEGEFTALPGPTMRHFMQAGCED